MNHIVQKIELYDKTISYEKETMDNIEIWKPVLFNTLYEVSSLGNFRNSKTKRQKTFNIEALKSTQSRVRVNIKNTIKKGSGFYLHRVIAMTFIPNPQNKPYVNHIDSDKTNNKLENLEWVTQKENCAAHGKEISHPRKVIQKK